MLIRTALAVSLCMAALAACREEEPPAQAPATPVATAAPGEAPPATAPPPPVSGEPGALDRVSADIDAQLALARQRASTASGQARQDADRDLARIEARARVVREQIKALPAQANDAAAEARRRTVAAAEAVKGDLKTLIDQLK